MITIHTLQELEKLEIPKRIKNFLTNVLGLISYDDSKVDLNYSNSSFSIKVIGKAYEGKYYKCKVLVVKLQYCDENLESKEQDMIIYLTPSDISFV